MAHSALTLLLVAACLASGAKAEGISKSECNARLISAAADHNTECAGLVTEMLAYSRCGDNCTADALIQAIFSDVGCKCVGAFSTEQIQSLDCKVFDVPFNIRDGYDDFQRVCNKYQCTDAEVTKCEATCKDYVLCASNRTTCDSTVLSRASECSHCRAYSPCFAPSACDDKTKVDRCVQTCGFPCGPTWVDSEFAPDSTVDPQRCNAECANCSVEVYCPLRAASDNSSAFAPVAASAAAVLAGLAMLF